MVPDKAGVPSTKTNFSPEDTRPPSKHEATNTPSFGDPPPSKPKTHKENLRHAKAKSRKTNKEPRFKPSEESIIIKAFSSKQAIQQALAFLKQFDAAFGGKSFIEAFKVHLVQMHLKDAAF